MNRVFSILLLCLLSAVVAWGMPARPEVWRTLTLADGSTVRAYLCGDEHLSFWRADNGYIYQSIQGSEMYRRVAEESLRRQYVAATQVSDRLSSSRAPKDPSLFRGNKKGLIILAEFPNKSFADGHDQTFYNRIANETNFNEGKFKGSVKDYFIAQSGGLFELDFDVVGPVMADSTYEYYGQPSTNVDAHPWDMVADVCRKVDCLVNFADYDWDGDGVVEQVFVLYAGEGECNTGVKNQIWPHEYELSKVTDIYGSHPYPNGLTLDGVTIDTYACSNELKGTEAEGIGTICHEFSHCMGLPDLYDTYNVGNFGMQSWDLMGNGGYNGDTFQPAGFTSYEKMVCGWLKPIELGDNGVQVDDMRPLSDGGQAYIIYNKVFPSEYYLLENRQKVNWDASLPGNGLLVLHVDYDETLWEANLVNTIGSAYDDDGKVKATNTHQRLTILHADNDDDRKHWSPSGKYYTSTTLAGDPYPYNGNDSITNNSQPAFSLYNANADGKFYLNRAVRNITQRADGIIAFNYEPNSETIVVEDSGATKKPDTNGAVFYESFDNCLGTGGNDGVFSGSSSVASADFIPDNDGWLCTAIGGATHCAKFGNASHDGIVTTPSIDLAGDTLEISFYAAPWGKDATSLGLSVEDGVAELGDTDFTMTAGKWTAFKTWIYSNGRITLTLTPGRRFFLDEFLVKKPATTGIASLHSTHGKVTPVAYYTLTGQRLPSPAKGISIVRYNDGSCKKLARKP